MAFDGIGGVTEGFGDDGDRRGFGEFVESFASANERLKGGEPRE